MAQDNKGLPMGPVPNKASFIYGKASTSQPSKTRREKGGDLRARKSKNNGK